MAFGFPPSAEKASYFDLPEKELAVIIKQALNILEWGIVNRTGKVLEARGEGVGGEKILITLKERGGVHARSISALSFLPIDGGKNSRNLLLFFGELERQVKMYQKNKK